MKILDWFKSLILKNKKDYMLNEKNTVEYKKREKKSFIAKVEVDKLEIKRTREDIIRNLGTDIIIEDLSEQYNYTKFSPENIKKIYDQEGILSSEDMTAIECLYGAIKDGNMDKHATIEVKNDEISIKNNKINEYLKKSPENIVTLINLMEKEAKIQYESLEDKMNNFITMQGLIPGSYSDISNIIDEYEKEKEFER